MITDVTTKETQAKRLTRTQFQQIATTNPSAAHRVKFSYQNMGHLVVLQLGHMVYGIDPRNKPRVLWEQNLSSLPGAGTTAPTYTTMNYDAQDNSLVLVYSDGWMQRLGEAGPLQGSVITLPMRDSLVGIDPVTGRRLWTRTDVTSRSHIFGDKENIYVVNLSDDGKPSGTRVIRAYDGVTVKAKDFTSVFNKRKGMQGRNILVVEPGVAKGGEPPLTLKMYDIVKGEDIWKEELPAGSIMMESEDPKLAGFVAPDGAIRVFDLEQRKEVMKTKLYDPKQLGKPQTVYLVSDPDNLYVAINGPLDPNIPNWGGTAVGPQPNVLPASGLRSIPVNGVVTAFNRKTGGLKWFSQIENQQMILSMMDELPMLLFTARYQYQAPPARVNMMKFTYLAYAKHNGKRWDYDDELPPNMFFHTLTMDHRSGKVEFTGFNFKAVLDSVAK